MHRQRKGDDLGCLAIRTRKNFILNGYYVISKTSLSIKLDNIRIDYIVNDTDEIIKSPGNISQSFLVQFLAGSMKNKLNNLIKLTYYLPLQTNRNFNSYTIEDYQNTNFRQVNFNNNHHDEISLKHVKKVKSSLVSIDAMQSEWVESTRTEGTPCDKMCNGKKRIVVKYMCMRGQKRVNETFCPGGAKSNIQYKEETCNNNCELK